MSARLLRPAGPPYQTPAELISLWAHPTERSPAQNLILIKIFLILMIFIVLEYNFKILMIFHILNRNSMIFMIFEILAYDLRAGTERH